MNKHDFDAPTVTHGDVRAVLDQVYGETAPDQDSRPKLPKRAAWQEDGSVLLGLRFPVIQKSTGPGGDVEAKTELMILRPLTGADVMRAQAAKGGMAGSMNGLIQASAGLFGPIGEDVLKRMDARDYLAVAAIVGVFTDPGQ